MTEYVVGKIEGLDGASGAVMMDSLMSAAPSPEYLQAELTKATRLVGDMLQAQHKQEAELTRLRAEVEALQIENGNLKLALSDLKMCIKAARLDGIELEELK